MELPGPLPPGPHLDFALDPQGDIKAPQKPRLKQVSPKNHWIDHWINTVKRKHLNIFPIFEISYLLIFNANLKITGETLNISKIAGIHLGPETFVQNRLHYRHFLECYWYSQSIITSSISSQERAFLSCFHLM